MPKYRFLLTSPLGTVVDDERDIYFDDDESARIYGRLVISGLMSDESDDFRGWSMEIKSEGRLVALLPLTKLH